MTRPRASVACRCEITPCGPRSGSIRTGIIPARIVPHKATSQSARFLLTSATLSPRRRPDSCSSQRREVSARCLQLPEGQRLVPVGPYDLHTGLVQGRSLRQRPVEELDQVAILQGCLHHVSSNPEGISILASPMVRHRTRPMSSAGARIVIFAFLCCQPVDHADRHILSGGVGQTHDPADNTLGSHSLRGPHGHALEAQRVSRSRLGNTPRTAGAGAPAGPRAICDEAAQAPGPFDRRQSCLQTAQEFRHLILPLDGHDALRPQEPLHRPPEGAGGAARHQAGRIDEDHVGRPSGLLDAQSQGRESIAADVRPA